MRVSNFCKLKVFLESPSYKKIIDNYKGSMIGKYNNQQSTIKKAASNVLENSRPKPIKLSNNVNRNMINPSFRTPLINGTNKIQRESFNRLGFENSNNDNSFNPHYEYNLRKVPQRHQLNYSVELKKGDLSGSSLPRISDASDINYKNVSVFVIKF